MFFGTDSELLRSAFSPRIAQARHPVRMIGQGCVRMRA